MGSRSTKCFSILLTVFCMRHCEDVETNGITPVQRAKDQKIGFLPVMPGVCAWPPHPLSEPCCWMSRLLNRAVCYKPLAWQQCMMGHGVADKTMHSLVCLFAFFFHWPILNTEVSDALITEEAVITELIKTSWYDLPAYFLLWCGMWVLVSTGLATGVLHHWPLSPISVHICWTVHNGIHTFRTFLMVLVSVDHSCFVHIWLTVNGIAGDSSLLFWHFAHCTCTHDFCLLSLCVISLSHLIRENE